MFIGTVIKQPGERKDRDVTLRDFFSNRPGDSIKEVWHTVDDDALVVTADAPAESRVKVWFEQGVDGGNYKVTVFIETEMGRRVEAEIRVRVREV